ncbi:MAG: CbiX/SirB N-terminal domain-containing protein [Bacteroidota bacterium]
MQRKFSIGILFLGLLSTFFLFARAAEKNSKTSFEKKIGVLLVNHGSRSATWRKSLLALEESVRPVLSKNTAIQGIKTAFMEYTEPSIATRMKEFDAEGFTDVVIVPIFLTVSPHTFDDIPTIIGKKINPESMEMLKIEKIERYTPKTNTVITPNLDFTDLLRKNVLRRVKSLTKNSKEEALVMIAYGDETYEKEWASLLDNVGNYVRQQTGIASHSYGWCGHLVHYDPQKTTDAIVKVLASSKKAIVIPLLVAHDEMFQVKIIGDGIANVENNKSRVVYRPDSILPDANVEQWVINISNEYVQKIQNEEEIVSTK